MGESTRRTPRQAGSRTETAGGTTEAGRSPGDAAGGGDANDTGTGHAKSGQAAGVGGITVVKPGQAEKGLPGLAAVKPGDKPKTAAKKPPNPLRGETTGKPKSKAADRAIAVGMTAAILSGGFAIVASRAGPHWQLQNQESQQLADPIVALLDRYGLLEKLAMNSEWIAMFAAIGVVVTPKVMYSQQLKAVKKAQGKEGQQNAQPARNNLQSIPGGKPAGAAVAPERAPAAGGGAVPGAAPAYGGGDVKGLLTELQLG